MNMKTEQSTRRRHFLRTSGLLGAGFLVPNLNFASAPSTLLDGNIHQSGKRVGYTGQISILVSMMGWMRATVLRSVKGISQKELELSIGWRIKFNRCNADAFGRNRTLL